MQYNIAFKGAMDESRSKKVVGSFVSWSKAANEH